MRTNECRQVVDLSRHVLQLLPSVCCTLPNSLVSTAVSKYLISLVDALTDVARPLLGLDFRGFQRQSPLALAVCSLEMGKEGDVLVHEP